MRYLHRVVAGIGTAGTLLLVVGCGEAENDGGGGVSPEALEVATGGSGAGAGPAAPPPDGAPGAAGQEADQRILQETMDWAREENLAALPMGERVVALGTRFVGSAYIPGTLEVSPEQLVVNLRAFDCVTYVESMLAMARLLDRPEQTFEAYQEELRAIRYRGGLIDGYPSRLHYFSDWILDNEEMGLLDNVTRALGGVELREPIDFMSTHQDSYPALASPVNLERVRAQERGLSEKPQY